jgi:hypothetical protein
VSNGKKSRKKIVISAIAACSAAIIAAVMLVYFFWYPTTPVYALSKTSKAIRVHDWATFSKYVDVEKLSMEVAKEVTVVAYQVMEGKGIPSVISKKLAVLYGTNVKKSLPGDIKAWVVNGTPPGASILSSLMKGQGRTGLGLKGISWDDGIARAKISTGKDSVLEVEMTREQDVWRVTRINNIKELYEKSKGKS